MLIAPAGEYHTCVCERLPSAVVHDAAFVKGALSQSLDRRQRADNAGQFRPASRRRDDPGHTTEPTDRVRLRMRVIWGGHHGRQRVECADCLGEAIPRASLHDVPDADHFVLEGAPIQSSWSASASLTSRPGDSRAVSPTNDRGNDRILGSVPDNGGWIVIPKSG